MVRNATAKGRFQSPSLEGKRQAVVVYWDGHGRATDLTGTLRFMAEILPHVARQTTYDIILKAQAVLVGAGGRQSQWDADGACLLGRTRISLMRKDADNSSNPRRPMMNLHLLLVLVLCALMARPAQTEDDALGDIELNPSEYVPLAVGNSWTYKHFYWNNSYHESIWWDIEDLKPFAAVEVPGYPRGEGNTQPPDSLLRVDRILTIEITHTERIDGREYFVFSDAEYDWPPLPAWFWAGKEVRLSDEGVLVFRWNGQEAPLYDFGKIRFDEVIEGYTVTLPGEEVHSVDRWVAFYEAPKTSNQHSLVHFYAPTETSVNRHCLFIRGYGMGLFVINFFGLSEFVPIFENDLTGLSANIDGEEIWYDQLDPYAIPSDPEPPAVVWGQLAKLNRRSGFDFSAGTETDYYSEDADVVSDTFPPVNSDRILLCSHTCVGLPPAKIVDLGRVDFGRLVSERQAADLQLVQAQSQIRDPQAGHTYAIWTREGGIALMHVLKVVGPGGRRNYALFDYIFFDWVYYPPSDGSPDGTAVQPTSWGALKRSILRTE